jgi:hypothetical protein
MIDETHKKKISKHNSLLQDNVFLSILCVVESTSRLIHEMIGDAKLSPVLALLTFDQRE